MFRAIFGSAWTSVSNHIPTTQGITTRVMICFFLVWLCMLSLSYLRPYQLNKFFWAKSFWIVPAVIGLFAFCMATTNGNLGPLYSSGTTEGGFGWFFMYAINAGMGNNATYITNQPDMTRWSKTLWGSRVPQVVSNLPFTRLLTYVTDLNSSSTLSLSHSPPHSAFFPQQPSATLGVLSYGISGICSMLLWTASGLQELAVRLHFVLLLGSSTSSAST